MEQSVCHFTLQLALRAWHQLGSLLEPSPYLSTLFDHGTSDGAILQ